MIKIKANSQKIWIIVAILVAVVGLSLLATALWYNSLLRPVDVNNTSKIHIDVKEGMAASDVSKVLYERGVTKNSWIFGVYMRLHQNAGVLKVGVYSVQPSQTVPEIADHLLSGRPDEFSITFKPGALLHDTSKNQESSIENVLKQAGYSEAGIAEALKAEYHGAVLANKPKDASLEGYLYGETYFMPVGSSAQEVIQRAITQMDTVVRENNFQEKFAKKGLTIHEGLTLASIVQKESLGCGAGAQSCDDQRHIAGVFYNRLAADMPLGSDVTYHYAADTTGQERDFRLDSPYNTRIHAGLPPTPIAIPGLSAMDAVADPMETDDLYFLSGDDNVTYFAKTQAEHDQNIRNHCQTKCLLP